METNWNAMDQMKHPMQSNDADSCPDERFDDDEQQNINNNSLCCGVVQSE